MISLKKRFTLIIICLSIIFVCINCDNKLTFFKKVDLSIKVPQNYESMNAERFESHFIAQSLYPDSLILLRKQAIESLILNFNHIFLQDTLNIYNNILISTPPFIPINKSTFKSVRTMMRRTLNDRFSNYKISEKESEMKNGTYPYAKVIYQVKNEQEYFQIAYYVVTKRNETKLIIINNIEEKDFEEIIRYLE